ncbi:DNA polymerase III subunit gamma/tau [Pseudoxanthomonas composti]|uniref:DNA polymerase III subunit gamma/tau n=1 Tax=Pseudoxanthomonas composti TaxID=2137479 RepID=A0A4Q1JU37_9GAMM|nr:DNA polymerase III subunit gamma/tau [Pseudoxanthomonas composti]RXR05200.1 DNA polymerase III subunit gamma/tau [Pseudoxanthomonas composti]
MSYLVLARKWRPKRFAELVGQEHVVRALSNALDSGRVHHAFLFTGTRGVGKTTIARIFAKSLNCETGTSADPCGQCAACLDIDSGRYIDLLEIDAASNTGVDDVREVIENAQYMPSRGKFKVYLIDEVHMLSKAAFNALLKTLEEPPEHVKFLLATTDPQKLPVTVLSRCLQFNLKRLDLEQITGQVNKILTAEGIAYEDGAVRQIAKAADGSLRDGLSLLDQAIAYTGGGSAGGSLSDEGVRAMLGTVDRTQVVSLLEALAEGDGQRLLSTIATLAEFSPDWNGVLDALAEALHRIQVQQLVPGTVQEADGLDATAFAARLRPEVVQLWYQMAINGRRDLYLAPSARAGFEMSVLRMLAFRPAQASDMAQERPPVPKPLAAPTPEAPPASPSPHPAPAQGATPQGRAGADAPLAAPEQAMAAPLPQAAVRSAQPPAPVSAPDRDDLPPWDPPAAPRVATPLAASPRPAAQAGPAPAPSAHAAPAMPAVPSQPAAPSAPPMSAAEAGAVALRGIDDVEQWLALVAACSLRGPSRELAANAAFGGYGNATLRLSLSPAFEYLRTDRSIGDLAAALAPALGLQPKIVFEAGTIQAETLTQRTQRERDARQTSAESGFLQNPDVQRLIQRGARLVPDSIRPFEE